MSKKSGFGKLFAGMAIGAGLGVLFAPKKGEETRKDLKKKIDEMLIEIKKIDADEVKAEFEIKLATIKTELETLNKEKALKIAKETAANLKEKTEDLLDYAVKKGTPILERTAKELKEKTIKVSKEVIEKLEKGK